MLETVKLGASGIDVTRMCLGCWAIGGAGWNDVDDAKSVETIRRALDLGINFLDSAEGYGRGHSEEVIGMALEECRGRRESVVIATKVSHSNLEPEKLHNSLDNSLARLKTDYIDLYQVHWPTSKTPVEVPLEEMMKLKEQGKIRAIGVSNFDVPLLERAVKVCQLDSLQPPFNMLWREIDADILPFCRENSIGIISYSSMAQGLLVGKFMDRASIPDDIRSKNVLFEEGIFEDCVEVAKRVVDLAEKYGKSPAQVAANWVINVDGIASAIVGAKRVDQVEDNVGALGWKLSDEDQQALSDAGMAVFKKHIEAGATMWGWKPD